MHRRPQHEDAVTIGRFSDDVCSKNKSDCTYGARLRLPALRDLVEEIYCRRSVVDNKKSYANCKNCDADDDFGLSVFEFEQLKDVVITVISCCGLREKKATGPATVWPAPHPKLYRAGIYGRAKCSCRSPWLPLLSLRANWSGGLIQRKTANQNQTM